jgi:dihydroxyacetone kinase-like protein
MGSKAEASLSRRVAAEFVGTAALVVCGPGTATATTMIAAGAGTDTSSGLNAVTALTQLGITALAFTMVIIAMIYTIGHISGCHINPAVTLALAITKKTRWNEVPGYLSAQLAGAITGAFATWAILQQPGLDTGLGTLHYPPGHTTSAFFAELIGTFLLILVVLATTTDSRATPGWHGLAIAAIVFAAITITGPITGAALNPARYLAPMITTAILDPHHPLPWNQTPTYLIAALTAALLATATYAFIGGPGPGRGQKVRPYQEPYQESRSSASAVDQHRRQGVVKTVDAAALEAWVREAARLIDDNLQYLTHLDAVIGDADHGANMRRGFRAAVAALDDVALATPGAVLDIAGQAFIANLGGAAGPLYGAGFRKAGEALGSGVNVSPAQIGVALRAALAAIQELGAAEVGDKTMVDAWDPAVRAFQTVIETGGDLAEATSAAAQAAERGLRATSALQARKGRASYIGARTIGHEDPGAASSALILRAFASTVSGGTGTGNALVPMAIVRRRA